MTRYFIEGSNNYYYNSNGYIEFCTKTKRFIKRDNIIRNNIIYCQYDIINSQNRKRIKNIPLYIFHIKYILQKNLDDVYITFKDNDSNNLSNENINYNLVCELCQEWLPCVHLGDNYEFYKNRGCINFKYLGKRYQITLYKGLNDYNDFIIKYFLSHEKPEVINKMNIFKSKSIKLLQEIKNAKENLKIKRNNDYLLKLDTARSLKNKKTEVKKKLYEENFKQKKNYNIIKNGTIYCFNIPYNLKYYYLGNISHEEIALQIDSDITNNKHKENFLIWFEQYKLTDFIQYKEKDKKLTTSDIRSDSKGYYWFKSRNCWKCHITHNLKNYVLGYFKCEDACKILYEEAKNMIKFNKFEIWFQDIKLHRIRIKSFH